MITEFSEFVKTCCFTGHRPKTLPWGYDESDLRCAALKSRIRFTLENLIVLDGYNKFISGMAMGADMICAEVVLSLKALYPHIKLECAVPSYAFTESWKDSDVHRFSGILTRADSIRYVTVNKIYSRKDLMLRNIYMTDASDIIIAVYIDGESGGTRNTIDYARAKNKEVIIIEP
ncbi:MAG: DUF1273 domain-containing protein [Oscillospiraceae bacterium]|nr:DUF1273 domain-containing protein [Oscillospiraceae bacterium]